MENLGLPCLKTKLFGAIAGAAEEYELEVERRIAGLKKENESLIAEMVRFGLRAPTPAPEMTKMPSLNSASERRKSSAGQSLAEFLKAGQSVQNARRLSTGSPLQTTTMARSASPRPGPDGTKFGSGPAAVGASQPPMRRRSFSGQDSASAPRFEQLRGGNTSDSAEVVTHSFDVVGGARGRDNSSIYRQGSRSPPPDMWRPKSASVDGLTKPSQPQTVDDWLRKPSQPETNNDAAHGADKQQSDLGSRRSFPNLRIGSKGEIAKAAKAGRSAEESSAKKSSPCSSPRSKASSPSVSTGANSDTKVAAERAAERKFEEAKSGASSQVSQVGELNDLGGSRMKELLKKCENMPVGMVSEAVRVTPPAMLNDDDSDTRSEASLTSATQYGVKSDGTPKSGPTPQARSQQKTMTTPACVGSSNRQRLSLQLQELLSSNNLQVPGHCDEELLPLALEGGGRRFSGVSAAPSTKSINSYVSQQYLACCEDEANAGLELWPVWRENPHNLRRVSLGGSMGLRKSITQSPLDRGTKPSPKDVILRRPASNIIRLRSRCIIHPNSTKRMVWDIIGMLFMVYDLIVIPLQVFDPPETFVSNAMSWVTLIFWSTDIPLSFVSGFQINGAVQMEPHLILLRYIRTWFFFDALVITIDWILTYFDKVAATDSAQDLGYMKMGRSARIVRMLRLLRLLRLLKVQGKLSDILEYIQSDSLRIILGIVKLIICIMLVNHVIACAWFSIGNLDTYEDTWVKWYRLNEKEIPFQYTTSLHWSLTQFTPASMEVNGRNAIERAFTLCVLLFAMVSFSSFISSITNATTLIRNLNSDEIERRTALFKYLKQHELPMALATNVWSWVLCTKDKSHHRIHEKDVVVLQLLPKSLRIQLKDQVYSPQVSQHPFFFKMYEVNPTGVAKMYSEVMDEVAVGLGQELFMTGEVSQHMFFLISGTMQYSTEIELDEEPFSNQNSRRSGSSSNGIHSQHSTWTYSEYLDGDEKSRVVIREGAWVSEPVLWVKWNYRGQLAAGTHSELYALCAAKFLEYITRDPAHHFEACNYARAFLHHMASTEVPLTDVWANKEVLTRLANEAFDDTAHFSPRYSDPTSVAIVPGTVTTPGGRSGNTSDPPSPSGKGATFLS